MQPTCLPCFCDTNPQRRRFLLFYPTFTNDNPFYKAKKTPNSQLSDRGFFEYIYVRSSHVYFLKYSTLERYIVIKAVKVISRLRRGLRLRSWMTLRLSITSLLRRSLLRSKSTLRRLLCRSLRRLALRL